MYRERCEGRFKLPSPGIRPHDKLPGRIMRKNLIATIRAVQPVSAFAIPVNYRKHVGGRHVPALLILHLHPVQHLNGQPRKVCFSQCSSMPTIIRGRERVVEKPQERCLAAPVLPVNQT